MVRNKRVKVPGVNQNREMDQGTKNSKVIAIRGARVNNLKNVDVDIRRNALTVITGLSGSGKSSLAFDTLYAEGQRRFVESLSVYARQFLERMNKPDVDSITGLPPAVAIQQQSFSKNPRSTVATTTEIYDYLRLLYGRIGVVIDKDSGEVVRKDTPESVCKELLNEAAGQRAYIMAALPIEHGSLGEIKEGLSARGFTRVVIGQSDVPCELDELRELPEDVSHVYVLVDRIVVMNNAEETSRLTDSLETALNVGSGRIVVRLFDQGNNSRDNYYSSKFENARSQTQYIEPEPRLFSFNNPFGACPTCQGFGRSVGIDDSLVFPDKSLTIKRGAIHPFRGESFGSHLRTLLKLAPQLGLPTDKPYYTLTPEQHEIVMEGSGEYIGVNGLFRMLEEKSYKTHYRVMLSRYRGYTRCRACNGYRLRTAARQVFIGEKNIPQVVSQTLAEARKYFDAFKPTKHQEQMVGQILVELRRRLHLLCDIGLDYLTLDRLSHTLSGGESQRINLATSLGSALVGTLYVLDEPSVGLHPRDTQRLLDILHRLKSLGNTVVVVEHDSDVIRTADSIVDIGPLAGENGGRVVFSGTYEEMINNATTLTAEYQNGKRHVALKSSYRKGNGLSIIVRSPRHHNLKGDDVELQLGKFIVVTGVSGSGKSSLVHDVINAGIQRVYSGYTGEVGRCDRIEGLANISGVEMIDQSSIGRSSRSTPATYTKIFDNIRDAFASTQAAKQLGWGPGHFSFNISGGRCDTCEGDGVVTIEMQFLSDIELPCEVCGGTRYKKEIANVLFRGKSIIDVLNMTVDDALRHFDGINRITQKLEVLQQVGLGYMRLGQPSTHLSGGEAQRVKLASHLDTQRESHILFIFDEPTTGLHIHDVSALLNSLDKLVDKGNTVLVIEHNVHVMAAADWIIDMGPDGGDQGGKIVATGTPKQVSMMNTHTAKALNSYFADRAAFMRRKQTVRASE